MAAIDNQPANINFLGQNGFRFAIKRLPNVNYFCQTVSLPSINLNVVETPTPFANIPRPGDRLLYDPLVIRFRVDENMANYFEIHSWLEGLGHPDELSQTRDISNQIRQQQIGNNPTGYASTYVSEGVLSILTSHKNVNKNIFFRDCFRVSLTELSFDSTNATLDYLEAIVTFRYRKYDLES